MCSLLTLLLVLVPMQKTELTSEEKAIVTRTNQERSKAKLPPLKVHPLLNKAAQAHADPLHGQPRHPQAVEEEDMVGRSGAHARMVHEPAAGQEPG